MHAHANLVDSLVQAGLLDSARAREVLTLKSDSKTPLVQTLVEAGLLGEVDLAVFLADFCGLPFVSVAGRHVDGAVLHLLPLEVARNGNMVPISQEGGVVTLAVADPFDVPSLDVARARLGDLRLVVAARGEILGAIEGRTLLDISTEMSGLLERIPDEDVEFLAACEEEEADEAPQRLDAPLIQMVNTLIVDAIQMKASDIHVEPQEESLRIRYRIDGVLRCMCELPRMLQSAVLSRLKLTSGMDISERRRPQDGRSRIKVGQRIVDLRVSSMPSYYGEKVVMRILDRAVGLPTLTDLGFLAGDLEAYRRLLDNAQGIILITGPTGSGKTTALYASLSHINEVGDNIVTIEDPIEFQLAGITQVQVNPRAGVLFSNAMRTILRQDPDVIMVGEIRDLETAEVAVQAAQTGHLVFSTLHTNSSAATLTRLLQMGVPSYLMASSLLGVTAQRLVRRLCPHCTETESPNPALLERLAAATERPLPTRFQRGRGCDRCSFTGLQGRVGLFEILTVSRAMQDLIAAGAPEARLEEAARVDGMHTLLEDGLRKVEAGITSLSEVLRVVSLTRRGAALA